MSETHEVLRVLDAGDRSFQPGEKVDAAEWPNVELLVEQKFLRPLDAPASTIDPVLLQRIEDLEKRVSVIEGGKKPPK